MIKILVIGKSGRLDCIADAFKKSSKPNKLYTISEVNNPGLTEKSEKLIPGKTENVAFIKEHALKIKPDFAFIGPEEPLEAGVADMLTEELGIPCIGPTRSLARLEWSKSFARNLLSKYNIPGNVRYRIFQDTKGLKSYLEELGEFVIKPDGLTSGKGVKVYGDHINSIEEGMEYCSSVLRAGHNSIVIEEKLYGEEFSFQSFCDGEHVIDTLAVQDHKRALDGDVGPNTGGMGSYSCEDHSLPFLHKAHIQEASTINLAVSQALLAETGEYFKGILYGGFIITEYGLKLLEYNVRFGDPEVMNILPLLKSDFIEICEAIITGKLHMTPVLFNKKATVCKYLVPKGYGTNPIKEGEINIDDVPKTNDNLRIYYAAVNKAQNGLRLTGSRALAFVGIGKNLSEAERISEDAISKIKGPVFHRKDIGTPALIQKRIHHMRQLLGEKIAA